MKSRVAVSIYRRSHIIACPLKSRRSHLILAVVVLIPLHIVPILAPAVHILILIIARGRPLILIIVLPVNIVLQNLPEVVNRDFAIFVLVGHLVEDFLLVCLDGAKLEFFKDVAEDVHVEIASLVDIEQVEGLLNGVKLLDHSVSEQLVQLSRRHFLLTIQKEVDLTFFDARLCDLACGLALHWERGEVLPQITLGHLLGTAV